MPDAYRVWLLALTALLGACNRAPPLAPELAAIKCPPDRTQHARAMFGKAELTFVCVSKKQADNPASLRCDPTSRPVVCEDAGSYVFTRDNDGTVYAGFGALPANAGLGSSSDIERTRSRLSVNFRNAPPKGRTFEEAETQWSFLLPDAKQLLPPQFTFVKGTLCDRASTPINSGACNLEARSASLYWHVAISIPAEKGTPISGDTYREELAFWLTRLGKLVVDPKK